MSRRWNIAVVGATGTVGRQLIECLEERGFPVGKIRFLAGGRNAGEMMEFGGKPVTGRRVDPRVVQWGRHRLLLHG